MRCKLLISVFLLVVFVGFVLADDSSKTRSDFTIAGCSIPGGGIPVDSCSTSGEYYCPDDGSYTAWVTWGDDAIDTACSYGKGTYNSGDPQCCPQNSFCGPNSDGDLVCMPRTKNCEEITDSTECSAEYCFWIADESKCITNPKEFGCSFYKTQSDCEADPLNLGREGEGTEVCGTYVGEEIDVDENGFPYDDSAFVIPPESCNCTWDDATGCNLSYAIYPEVFGTDPDYFRCVKHFDFSACVDYERIVSWNATPVDITGPGYLVGTIPTVPNAILTAAKCINGQEEKSCGKPLLQLPAFSFFALVSSLIIIFAIYFFKKNN